MNKIQELAASLQMELVPKQYVNAQTGIIDLVIIYNDKEAYPDTSADVSDTPVREEKA